MARRDRGWKLGGCRERAFAAVLPAVIGVEPDDPGVPVAAGRLDDFVRSVPQDRTAVDVRRLITMLIVLSFLSYLLPPQWLSRRRRQRFIRRIFDSRRAWVRNPLWRLRRLTRRSRIMGRLLGTEWPSMADFARFFKEVCNLAWYSSPLSNEFTGMVPLWEMEQVLAVHPETADDHCWTQEDRTRLDHEAITARHTEGADRSVDGLFVGDGRPRVAIIGSGPGGAAAAERLAEHFDVAVFEAGPRFELLEYPMDSMAAMALLYDRALLFPSANCDLRVLAARTVGGASVVNDGVTIRPRSTTLDSWLRAGAGFDRAALNDAIEVTGRRHAFSVEATDLLTSPSLRFAEGMKSLGDYQVEATLSDAFTREHPPHRFFHDHPRRFLRDGHHHHYDAHTSEVIGPRCLGCGYRNHGCRYGHHLSVDRTFLRSAEGYGARVHPNMGVDHLVPEPDPRTGELRIRALRLDRGGLVPVDHVVLAGGAIGTPALVRRTLALHPSLERLPAAAHFGRHLGFNYGTAVVARWDDRLPVPGCQGVQVAFMATRPGDETFILENGWITPPIFATLVPSVGQDHRRWMANWRQLGLAVNTIGSPSDGHVSADGQVHFSIGASQMGLIHETLADLVDGYLHSGAVEVGLAGVRQWDDSRCRFDPTWKGKRAEIRARLAEEAPTPEQLAFGSGHPQGGMRMHLDAEQGAVGPDYRVHGIGNLFVSDASLFPSTITINPRWLVMAMGWAAGGTIVEGIERDRAACTPQGRRSR